MSKAATKHNAVGPMAGYVFQVDRAFTYLSSAKANESVAVEYFDDVSVQAGSERKVQEQNKNSVKQATEILGDRSHALWHTLGIWLDTIEKNSSELAGKYVFAVNRTVSTSIASLMKLPAKNDESLNELIGMLRLVGKAPNSKKTKIQSTIDNVLRRSDSELRVLLGRIEIVDGSNVELNIDELANGFGIANGMEAGAILDSLRGWMFRVLREAWNNGLPGQVSRASAISQCRQIEALMARERLLPRPASQITVSEGARHRALTRPFVDQLQRISAGDEDIYEAVEHFLQFNVEKYRLAQTGEIPDGEWDDRSARLKDRWTKIVRSKKRSMPDQSTNDIGIAILEETTYHHREPIFNFACNEQYMTSGHYHRLADDSHVWWDPTYNPEKKS